MIPVYCFDPRQFGKTPHGFAKTGAFRAQFLLESVADLRESLSAIGSNLILRRGLPEEIIPALAQELGVATVRFYRETTSEELAVETALEQALKAVNISAVASWGHTLYHPDDLPFDIKDIPELFTRFRKEVEKDATVYQAFPAPQALPALPDVEVGEMPTLADFGLEAPVSDPRGVIAFKGGETAGIATTRPLFLAARSPSSL